MRLAEYLNSMPDAQGVRQLFVRESAGIYRFGSKRVFLKIEQEKIMGNIRCNNKNEIVRVGGGFLVLDEFIELYSPAEVERASKVEGKRSPKKAQNVQE